MCLDPNFFVSSGEQNPEELYYKILYPTWVSGFYMQFIYNADTRVRMVNKDGIVYLYTATSLYIQADDDKFYPAGIHAYKAEKAIQMLKGNDIKLLVLALKKVWNEDYYEDDNQISGKSWKLKGFFEVDGNGEKIFPEQLTLLKVFSNRGIVYDVFSVKKDIPEEPVLLPENKVIHAFTFPDEEVAKVSMPTVRRVGMEIQSEEDLKI